MLRHQQVVHLLPTQELFVVRGTFKITVNIHVYRVVSAGANGAFVAATQAPPIFVSKDDEWWHNAFLSRQEASVRAQELLDSVGKPQ